MKKKLYFQPSTKCFRVNVSELLQGSGGDRETMTSGSGSTPTSTTQNGVTGIFGESKGSSSWDDEE